MSVDGTWAAAFPLQLLPPASLLEGWVDDDTIGHIVISWWVEIFDKDALILQLLFPWGRFLFPIACLSVCLSVYLSIIYLGDRQTNRETESGISSHNFGGQEVPRSAFGKIENWETLWYNFSSCLKAWESGCLRVEEGISSLITKLSPSFCWVQAFNYVDGIYSHCKDDLR